MSEKYEFLEVETEGRLWIRWAAKGIGFGNLAIKAKNGKVEIDTEAMSDDFVKALLCRMVDDATKDGET